jgi:hypothetical protein
VTRPRHGITVSSELLFQDARYLALSVCRTIVDLPTFVLRWRDSRIARGRQPAPTCSALELYATEQAAVGDYRDVDNPMPGAPSDLSPRVLAGFAGARDHRACFGPSRGISDFLEALVRAYEASLLMEQVLAPRIE